MSGQEIVNINEEMKAVQAQLRSQIESGGTKIIKIKDKKFILPDKSEGEKIDVVVLDFITTQSYWEDGYQGDGDYSPPECFAFGPNPKSLVPVESSLKKQADDCNSCPNFQWGSRGKGKACKTNRLLAVIAADNPTENEILMLRVSPTAIKFWDKYVAELQTKQNLLPMAVVTEVSFATDTAYSTIRFAQAKTLSDGEVKLFWSRRQEAVELLSKEPDFQVGEEKAAPAKKRTSRRSS